MGLRSQLHKLEGHRTNVHVGVRSAPRSRGHRRFHGEAWASTPRLPALNWGDGQRGGKGRVARCRGAFLVELEQVLQNALIRYVAHGHLVTRSAPVKSTAIVAFCGEHYPAPRLQKPHPADPGSGKAWSATTRRQGER